MTLLAQGEIFSEKWGKFNRKLLPFCYHNVLKQGEKPGIKVETTFLIPLMIPKYYEKP
jgi:hypothetical protein